MKRVAAFSVIYEFEKTSHDFYVVGFNRKELNIYALYIFLCVWTDWRITLTGVDDSIPPNTNSFFNNNKIKFWNNI